MRAHEDVTEMPIATRTENNNKVVTVPWGFERTYVITAGPLHQLLWETAREYDAQTQNILRYARGVAATAEAIVDNVEKGRSPGPATSSDNENLIRSLEARGVLAEQIANLQYFLEDAVDNIELP